MSHVTMMNRTFRTSSRCALAAGFLVAAAHVGSAYAAVNPEPGGSSDPASPAAALARPADLVPNVPADYRLVRLVDQAQASAVHSQLAALKR
ncbi:MAG: hypothetical protein JWR52_2910 [Marmoricola sp.]|nr:hypothetical protein [Marmoricola sp.]